MIVADTNIVVTFARVGNLPLLRRLLQVWVRKVLNKKKVNELIRRVETEQGRVIKNMDEIRKSPPVRAEIGFDAPA